MNVLQSTFHADIQFSIRETWKFEYFPLKKKNSIYTYRFEQEQAKYSLGGKTAYFGILVASLAIKQY